MGLLPCHHRLSSFPTMHDRPCFANQPDDGDLMSDGATTDPIRRSRHSAPNSTMPSNQRAFRKAMPRFLNRPVGGRRGLDALERGRAGHHISAASSRSPAISPSRWRCAITAINSACTIRKSATDEASCSRSFATMADRLLDLGTKGSGQTPYSRHADGRLTLKGGVREVLATEMLEASGSTPRRASHCSKPARSWSAATSPPRPARRC